MPPIHRSPSLLRTRDKLFSTFYVLPQLLIFPWEPHLAKHTPARPSWTTASRSSLVIKGWLSALPKRWSISSGEVSKDDGFWGETHSITNRWILWEKKDRGPRCKARRYYSDNYWGKRGIAFKSLDIGKSLFHFLFPCPSSTFIPISSSFLAIASRVLTIVSGIRLFAILPFPWAPHSGSGQGGGCRCVKG